MEFKERVGQASSGVFAAAKHGARWGKQTFDERRLQGRIAREEKKIGLALYGLLREGKLQVDLPDVRESLLEIERLKAALDQRRHPGHTNGTGGGDTASEPGIISS